MGEFRFKQLCGASLVMVSTFIIRGAPLNDSLNCSGLTRLTAVLENTAGGARKGLKRQEEPFGAAQIPHGAPRLQILPPNLLERDEQLEVGCGGEQKQVGRTISCCHVLPA